MGIKPVGKNLFQEAVGETDVLLPIVKADIVLAFADMMSHSADDHWMLDLRNGSVSDAIVTEQFIHGGCSYQAVILSYGVSPIILTRASDIDRSGGDHGDQLVLVPRHLLFPTSIRRIIAAEPMREIPVDHLDCLT